MKKASILLMVLAGIILQSTPCGGKLILFSEFSPATTIVMGGPHAFWNISLREMERSGYCFNDQIVLSTRCIMQDDVNHGTVSFNYIPLISPGIQAALDRVSLNASAVPEPATLLLMGTGLFGIASMYRRYTRQ